jgi:hypothetical protein
VVLPDGGTQRGDEPAFLLNYYAKGFTGVNRDKPDEKFVQNILGKPWDKLPLEIVPQMDNGAAAKVFWQGKPAADVEVTLYVPGQDKPSELKTDKDGLFKPEQPKASGVYGIRARYVEKKAGEYDGKKYKEVRHYATMTFPVELSNTSNKAEPPAKPAEEPKRVADPEATKLLADARAARDTWTNFPGFTADIAVNLDGKVSKGTVKVSDKGDIELDVPDSTAAKWAKSELGSIVGHRFISGPASDTPCAFADDVTDHPLGRAIVVLNDEFHSSYRIKDRQIMVVNRNMKDSHFTISVMENRLSEDKKFLSSIFNVSTWDNGTGALLSSATHHQEWKRVGKQSEIEVMGVLYGAHGTHRIHESKRPKCPMRHVLCVHGSFTRFNRKMAFLLGSLTRKTAILTKRALDSEICLTAVFGRLHFSLQVAVSQQSTLEID